MPITQFNCSKQSCKTVLMTSDEQYVDSMREVAGMRVWVRTDVTLCMNSVRNYNTDVTLCIRDPESWIGDWLLSQSRSGTVIIPSGLPVGHRVNVVGWLSSATIQVYSAH